jgi:hypothetical protein
VGDGRRPASRRLRRLLLAVTPVLLAACAGSGAGHAGGDPPNHPAAVSTAVPPVTGAPAAPAATTTVAAVAPPAFTGTSAPVGAADLPSSWRPGCPVAPEGLRLLRVSHWGFDDQPHVGSIVVAASVTDAVLEVFRTLYDQRFPIRRMEPVDAFGGDDDASMAADNTSGFNCRPAVTTGAAHWSNHAYGLAIDVNPVENPYLLGGQVLPPEGAEFVDRSVYRPGMAVEGGVLTSAFAQVGWGWGGSWAGSPDYQHFSATGN